MQKQIEFLEILRGNTSLTQTSQKLEKKIDTNSINSSVSDLVSNLGPQLHNEKKKMRH